MEVVYPRPQSECPNYFEVGGKKWQEEVRIANHFGDKTEYNIGDNVETITFYFPDSLTHRQNHVIIERGIIESTFVWKNVYHILLDFPMVAVN